MCIWTNRLWYSHTALFRPTYNTAESGEAQDGDYHCVPFWGGRKESTAATEERGHFECENYILFNYKYICRIPRIDRIAPKLLGILKYSTRRHLWHAAGGPTGGWVVRNWSIVLNGIILNRL